MKKEHLIWIGVGVAGIILYKRWDDNRKAKAAANAAAAAAAVSNGEEASNASGVSTGGSCASGYSHAHCQQTCESEFGGTYDSSDRKCYVNGRAVTGGVFGSRRLRSRAASM